MNNAKTKKKNDKKIQIKGNSVALKKKHHLELNDWGEYWISWIEKNFSGSRYSRGQEYFQTNKVLSIDVLPGIVRGKVSGSREKPYRVSVSFAPLIQTEVERLINTFSQMEIFDKWEKSQHCPITLIRKAFQKNDICMFPISATDVGSACSCPDEQTPCKHVIALFFSLAVIIRQEPGRYLLFRGMNISESIINCPPIAHLKEDDSDNSKNRVFNIKKTCDSNDFWNGPRNEVSSMFESDDDFPPSWLLLQRLGPFPQWNGVEDLQECLKSIYLSSANYAKSHLLNLPYDLQKIPSSIEKK